MYVYNKLIIYTNRERERDRERERGTLDPEVGTVCILGDLG